MIPPTADRLAGDDLRHGVPLMHRPRIHEPRHDLLIGAHIRTDDIGARPDEGDHLLHVAARERLQLARRKRAGVYGHAAFRAAVRQAGERAFPAHPDGERGHFAKSHAGVKAHASLGRSKGEVMLHAVAVEDFDLVHCRGAPGASRRACASGEGCVRGGSARSGDSPRWSETARWPWRKRGRRRYP